MSTNPKPDYKYDKSLQARMASGAEVCLKTLSDMGFYTPTMDESGIRKLDDLITSMWEGEKPNMIDQMAYLFGSLYGESIRMEWGGFWVIDPATNRPYLTEVGGGGTIDPLNLAFLRFEKGMEEPLIIAYDQLLQLTEKYNVRRCAVVLSEQIISTFRSICQKYNVDFPDCSEDAILQIDDLIPDEWNSQQPPEFPDIVLGLGAYLGECIRLSYGGRWVMAPDNSLIVIDIRRSGRLSPIQIAKDRLNNGTQRSITQIWFSIRNSINQTG